MTSKTKIASRAGALLWPIFAIVIYQIPLEIPAISRAIAPFGPYGFFLTMLGFALFPSYLFLWSCVDEMAIRRRYLLGFTVALVAYVPILMIEFFYTACTLFDNCHLL